jgi:uncharacterized coiled-coil protein SlyX
MSDNGKSNIQERLEIQEEVNRELKEKFVLMEEEQNRIILHYKGKYKKAQNRYTSQCGESAERVCFEHRQIEEGLNQRLMELEDQIVMREDKIDELSAAVNELKEALRKTVEREEKTVQVTKKIMEEKDEVIKKLVSDHTCVSFFWVN